VLLRLAGLSMSGAIRRLVSQTRSEAKAGPVLVSETFSRRHRIANSPFWMAAAGFLARVISILVVHSYRFVPREAFFTFGYETGRIAESIATGHGFSNPFQLPTGPTAWVAPAYPYVAAGVFKLFGIYTQSSAFVLLTLNSLFAGLTCIPLYYIARRSFGPRVARWSGWAWALLPFVMYYAVRWIWETSLSAFLLTTAVWLTMELEDSTRVRDWLWWGAAWGILALTNPSCLSVLPFAGVWLCWRRMRHGRPWFTRAALAALIFILLLAPWGIRNYRTFHKLMLVRSNPGAELRLGNYHGAWGTWASWLHPTQNIVEFQKYQRMGEIGYVAERKREALNFIENDPGEFATLCVKKFVYFWAGLPRLSKIPWLAPAKNSLFLASSLLAFFGGWLAWRQRKPGAALFVVLLAVYPLVYYIVFPDPRYRHPIEPACLILIAFVLSQTTELREDSPRTIAYSGSANGHEELSPAGDLKTRELT
jgi:4-amino-4-deoxy-L-arabinose transferase-like glycosyltransferase